MKTKNIFSAIFMMGLMMVGSMTFSSCDDGTELDTNQYVKGIALNAFGPSPVARGGELRFIGSNLNQVTAVAIPGCGDITDITVISAEEIRVTVPQTAEPGYVTLRTPSGDITTVSRLTYTEPVGFDADPFSPSTIKPGNLLTISGEYLNLVTGVEFADGVEIPCQYFEDQSRSTIVVEVPVEAQTGKVAITFCATGDTIPNVIYSDAVLNVVTPSVESVADLTGKKPGDEITLAGKDLDLVYTLTVAGNEVDFDVNNEGSKITFNLPDNTPAQATVAMYPASGVEIVIATIGMKLPSDLAATPATDLRNGDKIVISGKDLDVVSNVTFPGVATPVAVEEQSAESITVTCPEGFTSGDLVLNLKSGASVTIAIQTLKPSFAAYNPSPVSANNDLEISGQNLDLVTKVKFSGIDPLEVTPSAEAFTIKVPTTAESGVVTLIMGNGETVELPELTIEKPECAYILNEDALITTDDNEIKAGAIVVFDVANADKITGVKVDGTDCQFILQGSTVYVGTPESAGFNSVLTLISSNGEISYTLSVVPNTIQKRVLWKGMTEITWNDGGRVFIPGSALEEIPEGATLTFCYTQKDQVWAQAQINDGWWGNSEISTFTMTDGTKINNPIVPTDIYGWFADGQLNRETSIVLTAELLAHLRSHVGDDGSAIIIQGQDLIFTQIYVSWEISLETNINGDCVRQEDQSVAWSFPSQMSWDDSGRFRILRNGPSNIKDMKLKAGSSKMYIYKSGTGQCQINNPNWGTITTVADWEGNTDVLEVVLTQDLIDCFTGVFSDGWSETALIIQGDGLTVSKITILP